MSDDSGAAWSQPSLHETETPSNGEDGHDPNAKRRELLAREKLGCLKHLILSLDALVYAQIFVLYYMDCSFFRLFVRSVAQLVLFTPPAGTPITDERPYMTGLLFPNFLCTILHVFTARPEAGELVRGYLHGGVIMDLIGQTAPTSNIHMLLIDILIMALQCFLLAVNTEYKTLHFYIRDKEYRNLAGTPSEELPRGQQDHDAEERGILRIARTSSNDIELNDLSPHPRSPRDAESSNDDDDATANEQHSLLGDHLLHNPRSRDDELEEWLNLHYAGIAVTAEFHIIDTLRRQYRGYKTRAEMIRATEAVFASGSAAGQVGGARLASVSDIRLGLWRGGGEREE